MSSLDRFRRQPHTRARGASAEAAGLTWLEAHGYEILETNYVTKAGEIDAIGREGETLCFIEIKARATETFGPAVAAVNARKQRKIVRSASLYLAREGYEGACRFDVLGLDPAPDGWSFTLVRNAFGTNY